MPLTVTCACGKKYQVDEALAGKRVKCKACGASIQVPPPQPAATAADDDLRLAPLDVQPQLAIRPAAAANAAVVAKPAVPNVGVATTATPQAAAASELRPTSGLPFFLAVSQGWSKSLVYRVYADRDALLLLDVGPYNVLIDLEVARRADGSHWAVKTVQSLKSWVLSIVAVVGSILGLLGIGIARAGFRKPNEALQLVSFLIMVAAFTIPGILLLATWSMRVLVRRSEQLDALGPEDVRQLCAQGGDKYRLAAGALSEVQIKPPKNPGPAIRHKAEATFKHPSGNWKLLLFAPQDVQLACTTFRRLVVPEVKIDPALERM